MADKHKIATVDELEEQERIISEIAGVSVAVFNLDGELHAIANYCPHQAGPLCEGPLSHELTMADDGWNWEVAKEDEVIKCPWHKWDFDIKSGENIRDDRYTVPTYDVEVSDEDVFVVI